MRRTDLIKSRIWRASRMHFKVQLIHWCFQFSFAIWYQVNPHKIGIHFSSTSLPSKMLRPVFSRPSLKEVRSTLQSYYVFRSTGEAASRVSRGAQQLGNNCLYSRAVQHRSVTSQNLWQKGPGSGWVQSSVGPLKNWHMQTPPKE